jgi:ornithine--oxo-acid transaminase
MNPIIALEEQFCAQNYHPIPVVLTHGKGVYVWDEQDKKYLDMMSAYSAVSHGHCHPRIVKALQQQADKLTIVSRAFHSSTLALFLKKICEMTGQEKALPMNTGAEAVETAIKAARKWAYKVKQVPDNQAEIIVCEGNFHGRTIAIIGMSTEFQYRDGFGPFTGGFKVIPYNDLDALEKAITPNTAAFLVEPVQGEAGIRFPSEGYLKKAADLCKKHNVLFIADEIQCGLGRTGKLLACDHENVKPDGLILGKALGGGILPVSMFLAKNEVMDIFNPGDHGSTFGGNPLAAVVATEALEVLEEENFCKNSTILGALFLERLRQIKSKAILDIRGKGLFIGLEIKPEIVAAREVCLKLKEKGLLTKDTHGTVIRLAPPLVINSEQIEWAAQVIADVLSEWN